MSDTIPETVAAVLALDATASPARNWSKPSGYDPDAMCSYYYRTAAPALAREVERLQIEMLKRYDEAAGIRNAAADRNSALVVDHALREAALLAERDEARAECERLRAVYAAALAMLAADEREDADPMGGHDVGHAVDAGKARRALLKATKAARKAEVPR